MGVVIVIPVCMGPRKKQVDSAKSMIVFVRALVAQLLITIITFVLQKVGYVYWLCFTPRDLMRSISRSR